MRDVERLVASGGCADDPAEMRRASDRVRDRAAFFFQALRDLGVAGGARAVPARRVAGSPARDGQPAGRRPAGRGGARGRARRPAGRRGARAGTPARTWRRSAAAAGETRDELALPASRRRSGLRLLPRDPRPRRVPARVADRRLDDRARAAARPDAGDRPDVGHAERRRLVRLRPAPPRRPRRRRNPAAVGVPTTQEQAILYLPPGMPDPRSPLFASRRQPRGPGDPEAHRGAGVRPLHQLLGAAGGRAPARRRRWTTRCWSRAAPRARSCSGSSGRWATRCCWRRRASGRAWTWSAKR